MIERYIKVTFMILILFTNGCTAHSNNKNREALKANVERIQIGMNRQEVKELLGKPDSYSPKSDPTHILYIDRDMEKANSWEYIDLEDSDLANKFIFAPGTSKIIKIEKINSSVY